MIHGGWRRTQRRFCSDTCKYDYHALKRMKVLVSRIGVAEFSPTAEGHGLNGNDVLTFFGIEPCKRSSGKAKGQRCSWAFPKNTGGETAEYLCSDTSDMSRWLIT